MIEGGEGGWWWSVGLLGRLGLLGSVVYSGRSARARVDTVVLHETWRG